MYGINLRHCLATIAIAVGALATAGSASAATQELGVIVYNGHAGLGASVYQHNQTDLEFLAFAPVAAGVGSSQKLAAADRGAGAVLMADMGGQFR